MRIFMAIVTLALFIGCADTKKKEIEQLEKDVIALHDEVMPMMDRLYQTRMELQKMVGSEADSVALITAITSIKNAEDHMMNWMRNFNSGYEGANPDETIQYFLDQKNSIEAVSKLMKSSQLIGDKALGK